MTKLIVAFRDTLNWDVSIGKIFVNRLRVIFQLLVALSQSVVPLKMYFLPVRLMIWYIYELQLGCHPVAVHSYTQTIYRTTQITTNVEECWPCPVFASYTLAFTTEEKVRKNLIRSKTNFSQVKKNLSHSTVYILPKHPHITKPTETHTLIKLNSIGQC
jgi:hypothetical protein